MQIHSHHASHAHAGQASALRQNPAAQSGTQQDFSNLLQSLDTTQLQSANVIGISKSDPASVFTGTTGTSNTGA